MRKTKATVVQLGIYERALNEIIYGRDSDNVVHNDQMSVLALKGFETEIKTAVLKKVNEILDDVDCGCSKGDCPHAEARDTYRFRINSQICPRGGRNDHSVYMKRDPNHPGWNILFCDACGADVTPIRPK